MKITLKRVLSCIIISVMFFTLTGFSYSEDEVQALKKNMTTIKSIAANDNFDDLMSLKNILKDKNIIGIGEATHGNKEFIQIKQHVFEFLVKNMGIKTYAMEGDFGGGQVINDYILNGTGIAEDAVKSLDMAVYNVQELADMVKWMHDYNLTVSAKDKIHFYGFDMQRYDRNKDALLKYISKVDNSLVSNYKDGLTNLNDETVFNQDKAKIKSGMDKIKEIIKGLNSNKDKYIKLSSEKEYLLASKHAEIILQNATIRYDDSDYSTTRDAFMAENIKWILQYEKLMGNQKIFISAHDGHIEKSSSSAYHSMGNILADSFGKQYYAIGTEFYESTFRCRDDMDGERKLFYIKSGSSSYIANKLMQTGVKAGWIDFGTAISDKVMSSILQSPQKLHNIGDSFSNYMTFWDKFYMLNQTPAKAYDGLIFINTVTPTTQLSSKTQK